MRRDEGLLATTDEARQWLEMYRHTIADPTVLKVVELLETEQSEEWDDLQNQLAHVEDRVRSLEQEIEDKEETISELNKSVYKYSLRGQDWLEFSDRVLEHIEKYTVPQYGDKGEDQASEFTSHDLMVQVRRYTNRFGKNARPGQDLLDIIKMAHYIQMTDLQLRSEQPADG